MTFRGLLRIALLLALVPLVLKRTGATSTPVDDEFEDDADLPMDPDADAEGVAGLIDINSASEEILAALPGIGAMHAADIAANRPYRAKRDLVRRGIVSEATYQTIRDQIIARQGSFDEVGQEQG